jgi:hypothetical protein
LRLPLSKKQKRLLPLWLRLLPLQRKKPLKHHPSLKVTTAVVVLAVVVEVALKGKPHPSQ